MRKPNPRYETLEYTVTLIRETDKAWQLSRGGVGLVNGWFPKSQVKLRRKPDGYYELLCPRWLAEEKGFEND